MGKGFIFYCSTREWYNVGLRFLAAVDKPCRHPTEAARRKSCMEVYVLPFLPSTQADFKVTILTMMAVFAHLCWIRINNFFTYTLSRPVVRVGRGARILFPTSSWPMCLITELRWGGREWKAKYLWLQTQQPCFGSLFSGGFGPWFSSLPPELTHS